MHESKKIAIEFDVNQDEANQAVVSDTVSTEYGINVPNQNLPE